MLCSNTKHQLTFSQDSRANQREFDTKELVNKEGNEEVSNSFVLYILKRKFSFRTLVFENVHLPSPLRFDQPHGGGSIRRGVPQVSGGRGPHFLDVGVDALVEVHVEGVPRIAGAPPELQAQVRRTVLHGPRALHRNHFVATSADAFSVSPLDPVLRRTIAAARSVRRYALLRIVVHSYVRGGREGVARAREGLFSTDSDQGESARVPRDRLPRRKRRTR